MAATAKKPDPSQAARKALTPILADLIDLSLQGKQAHWNVRGRDFQTVHEQLDLIVTAVRLSYDEVAECIVTLGGSADGGAAQIAKGSRLPPFPTGLVSDSAAVEEILARLDKVVDGLRQGIGELDGVEPVTQDLLIATAAGIEKQAWMLRAKLSKA